jgi:hypothetical protein
VNPLSLGLFFVGRLDGCFSLNGVGSIPANHIHLDRYPLLEFQVY